MGKSRGHFTEGEREWPGCFWKKYSVSLAFRDMTVKMRGTSLSVLTMLLKKIKESDNKKYTWGCMKTGIWELV